MQMMNFNTQKLLAVSFWGTLLLCTSVPQVAAAPYWSTVVETMPADQKVKGKVVNDKGEPLPGVSIAVKGTGTGTATRADGTFQLNVPAEKTVLILSYLGYKNQEVLAADHLNIVLQEDVHMLGEVVVSTQKRNQSSIEVPVAVSALSGGNLKKLNVQQFDEMAQYIPGLQIQLQSPNNPGYVIRGVTSDDGDSRSQPRISVFQDGVSISRSRASVVELFDLERVEVVKVVEVEVELANAA